MLKRIFLPALFLSVFLVLLHSSFAQLPTWTIDLVDKEKKPEKFENRKLGSERMAEKKFTLVRNFFQNNYTHYNYYFNANNKINTVIERAKAAQKDDYSKLLSYYPYSLENTATQKSELDSVIFKATAGILLHDLRNDWIDNMYLLMGRAFYYRKEFDSAAATFQFINYNLFPRKKHEDDSRVVGTTDAASNSIISIANKEKQNILQKVTALPPSRNDALIWMARTLIEQNEMGESAGLINTLEHDPNLPKRLQNDLDDINAYWYYKQQIYDSAANYLERALSTAENNADLARSEFLLAQLYEITNQFDKASAFYERVSTHTVDPIMDIHARLNNAKMLKSSNPEALTNSINHLVGMSKKDRFEPYLDIIFYSAGELAMQKPDTNAAVGYFNKSVAFNQNNISYKNKAFLTLADIAYARKQYKMAFAFYDSLQSGDTTLNSRLADIQSRRDALAKMVAKIVIIEREDSLQHIAAMPAAERENYLKKMARRLRKEKGLKYEENNGSIGSAIISFDNLGESKKNDAVDLFAAGNKGEWYFYNNAAKANGINEFKRKWGPRKNVDNWQRKNAPETSGANNPADGLNTSPDDVDKPVDPNRVSANQGKDLSTQNDGSNPTDITQSEDISYEGLMSGLPLTPEKMHESHTLIATNIFALAKIFQEDVEDYREAINTYEESLSRYPDSLYDGELYLGLYYCYTKLGNAEKAAYYKSLINKNFASSHSALILNNPSAVNPQSKNSEGTKRYEAIYNLFIEGNFDQAFAEKRKADSIYGNNYWSPQLLYIEAVYHIKQQKDSIAISVLSNILSLYPGSKLAPKAERMIDVLKRRSQIEEYLSKLQITRAKDDEIVKIDERTVLKRNDLNLIKSPVSGVDTTKTHIKASALKVKDSLKITPPPVVIKDTVKTIVPPPPAKPIVKDSVKITNPPVTKDTTKAIVLAPLVKPAVKDTVKIVNPTEKDTAKAIVLVPLAKPAVKDSVKKATTVFVNGPFTIDVESPHNVIMLMNKVDVTYVNESKNAFNRYLSQNFRDDSISLSRDVIDKDRALLVFTSFRDATAAYNFLMKVKKAAPDEVSWLPANKYSFYLINDENLQLLKTNKDLAAYIGLLNKVYPGKF